MLYQRHSYLATFKLWNFFPFSSSLLWWCVLPIVVFRIELKKSGMLGVWCSVTMMLVPWLMNWLKRYFNQVYNQERQMYFWTSFATQAGLFQKKCSPMWRCLHGKTNFLLSEIGPIRRNNSSITWEFLLCHTVIWVLAAIKLVFLDWCKLLCFLAVSCFDSLGWEGPLGTSCFGKSLWRFWHSGGVCCFPQCWSLPTGFFSVLVLPCCLTPMSGHELCQCQSLCTPWVF